MSNRKSPSTHAADLKIGTVKLGNDRSKWIVTERKDGSHQWVEYSKEIQQEIKAYMNKPPEYIIYKPQGERFKIAWGEIFYINMRTEGKGTGLVGGGEFIVNENFYKQLQSKPILCENTKGSRNAYIFGKLYPLSTYKRIGGHGNDGASTSLIDVTKLTFQEKKMLSDYKKILKCYSHNNKIVNNLDNRESLEKLQKTVSNRILFMGSTYGGDVGADYFAHFDISRQMDSLIIDTYCLFTDSTLKFMPIKVKLIEKKISIADSKDFNKKFIVKYLENPYEPK
jgi:hypothetical protein